ncbi:MDIS1-interacting receptor like kinase 2-like [Carex rostrata]
MEGQSGNFSVKSAYMALKHGPTIESSLKQIWNVSFCMADEPKQDPNNRQLDEEGLDYGGDTFSIWNFDGRDAYEVIVSGCHARVYKAILASDNVTVAVKKIQLSGGETSLDVEAFHREIHTITQIQHRNIVKLLGNNAASPVF